MLCNVGVSVRVLHVINMKLFHFTMLRKSSQLSNRQFDLG